MRTTIYSRKFLIISILIAGISLSNIVVACECEFPTACVAFTQAEAVFVGKVQKIVTDEDEFLESVEVKFEVEKIYKGEIAKYKVVKFSTGDCSIKFQEGDRYFVYENTNNNIATNYCNKTGLLEGSKKDIEYADSLSQNENDLDKWLNIKVFVTTRDEVEKLYGVGEKGLFNDYVVSYCIPEGTIDIDYASGDCKASKTNLWNVPAWTVTEVSYSTRKRSPKLNKLIPDKSQFKSKESYDVPQHIEYFDDERGITIIYDTIERRVRNIIIRPSVKALQEYDCSIIHE